jgi:S-methylmethionine-dependent homocysteine/selenocysteine methylase
MSARQELDWQARLRGGAPLLLDGATGTELERRGARCELPLWSARALLEAPELVLRIHADYLAAGAEVLTANTFRTQARTLAGAGLAARDAELTARALDLARSAAAAAGRPVAVLGSAPPLADCFRPDLAPAGAALAREHARHAENLAGAGADAILVETMNSVREARAALVAARAVGLPAWLACVCWRGPELLSGEPLAQAVALAEAQGAAAVLVNCLPPSNVAACLPVLAGSSLPFGVYANLGAPLAGGGRNEDCTPEAFADHVAAWLEAGARIVGGCCGTTPAHVAAAAQLLRSRRAAPPA